MPNRIAYLPLNSYPEAPPETAVLAAVGFAGSLKCGLHVATFAVDIPRTVSPIGGFGLNVEGMAATVEERSKVECTRLQALVSGAAQADTGLSFANHRVTLGAANDVATAEARTYDLALVAWSEDTQSTQDMAQSLVFGAGVPVILVPPSAKAASVDHIAIAWDGGKVAARALCDALPFLAPGGHVSVLTVQGEKSLNRSGGQALASALERRGYAAKAVDIAFDGRSIAVTLQETALAEGAQLLAMGGFGHSRLRDFILGGATKGVFADLRLAVLLSH